MKRIIFLLITFLCIIIIMGCRKENNLVKKEFEILKIVNNLESKENIIKKKINVEEFSEINLYGCTLEEVNKKYTIECLRKNNNYYYAIFSSKQEGWLYILFELKNNKYVVTDELGITTYDFAKVLRNDAYSYLGVMGYTNYLISDVTAKNYEGVRVKRNHDSATSYAYNLIIKQLYDEFSVVDDKGIITIEVKGYNPEKIESKYEMIGMDVHDSVITVDLPFKVLENNADSVDSNNNIYKWYIDSDTVSKDILLKYDVNNVYKLNLKTIGTKVNMVFVYIVLVILVLLFLGGISYLYLKKIYQNRNKF